ncbi:hypothetical protein TNCV_2878291 [Trichonephila clavipes]|uniref:Uncharacterized protein n=1 Tax=Trichonephila clavipes TaxID=2585209 RepID=A0A8X6W1D7_TRICX|nr:hypothetical protein TNCV_2878291 [Trichonephila clavipes]
MEHLQSLLEEVEILEKEIDQAREEPVERMDSKEDNKSKFEKNDEHEKFESKKGVLQSVGHDKEAEFLHFVLLHLICIPTQINAFPD